MSNPFGYINPQRVPLVPMTQAQKQYIVSLCLDLSEIPDYYVQDCWWSSELASRTIQHLKHKYESSSVLDLKDSYWRTVWEELGQAAAGHVTLRTVQDLNKTAIRMFETGAKPETGTDLDTRFTDRQAHLLHMRMPFDDVTPDDGATKFDLFCLLLQKRGNTHKSVYLSLINQYHVKPADVPFKESNAKSMLRSMRADKRIRSNATVVFNSR